MLVECMPRPELRAPVLELIARIHKAHTGSAFTIALADMFESFGLSLGANEWARLRQRGDVRFTPESESQGDFTNSGAKLELPTDEGLTIVIPPTLAGDYITTETSLTLKFAEGQALRGCKRIFVLICQDIIKIDADEHKLYIDLPGEKYDLCFVF
ncbi:MAG TPA: hypothetical protein VIW80_12550 [Pyrinomonadaceae bacterium]|jgi:hypothetical protein